MWWRMSIDLSIPSASLCIVRRDFGGKSVLGMLSALYAVVPHFCEHVVLWETVLMLVDGLT